ncbi:hypothetical protein D1Z90_20880 [Motilimonas pumila]|uniref:Uncharacterized protein n=2 Tax=Motilimonas pumila TaxID=2303987 RepID=A0A418Y8S4_9GAMM|nr:hypothetical protein D1Z90_20880 [Motilimonas pumila]
MHQLSIENMEDQVERLIKDAQNLIEDRDLSEIIICPYHGRERGDYFNISESEIEGRVKASIFEGYYVDLIPTLTQLIVCVWEYPGPKPEEEYVKNLIDIPSFVEDLEGE